MVGQIYQSYQLKVFYTQWSPSEIPKNILAHSRYQQAALLQLLKSEKLIASQKTFLVLLGSLSTLAVLRRVNLDSVTNPVVLTEWPMSLVNLYEVVNIIPTCRPLERPRASVKVGRDHFLETTGYCHEPPYSPTMGMCSTRRTNGELVAKAAASLLTLTNTYKT